MNKIIEEIEKKYIMKDRQNFSAGDTIKVSAKIVEGDKERVQAFEGTVLAIKGKSINQTVFVRKITNNIAIERCFLVHSPRIVSIETVRRGRVRRAKLYYLRDRKGKSARVKEKLIKREV